MPNRKGAWLGVVAATWLLSHTLRPADAQCCQAKLIDPEPVDLGSFGQGVAIAAGKAFAGGVRTNSIWEFERSGRMWVPLVELSAPGGPLPDGFGSVVAIDGATLVIGVRFDSPPAWSGSAHVFERSAGGDWVHRQRLVASDADMEDRFGTSIALDGDVLVIGTEYDEGGGSAYVFERDAAGLFQEVVKLRPNFGGFFGLEVAVRNQVILIGAPANSRRAMAAGAAAVVEKINGDWIITRDLFAADANSFAGFGHTVGIDSGIMAIGAPNAHGRGANTGAVYIFENIAGVWTQTHKLFPSPGSLEEAFGRTVVLHRDILLVGSARRYDGHDG